jgi:hypothetical protein
MLIAATLFAVAAGGEAAARAEPAGLDMQQRLRTATERMTQVLLNAGGGVAHADSGAGFAFTVPSVMPWRVGVRGDTAGVVRSDAISVLSPVPGLPALMLAEPLPASAAVARVDLPVSCARAVCGFEAGMVVLLVGRNGQADLCRLVAVGGNTLQFLTRGRASGREFPTGSLVMAVEVDVFALKPMAGSEPPLLIHGDGDQADMPLTDHVVRLEFDYFGEPAPPAIRDGVSSTGVARRDPPTTYGPAPPAMGDDDPTDRWASGENCVFGVESGRHVSRLPVIGSASGLVPIDLSMLRDGPWCPDEDAANRFDADVFRIRQVRVRLRVQAASADLRGRGPDLFGSPGTSMRGLAFVPDREVVFDVVPRSGLLGR